MADRNLDVDGVWNILEPVRAMGRERTASARHRAELNKKDRDTTSAMDRVNTKLQRHNETNIVREVDRIEMESASAASSKNRGWNMRWSPVGWLRSCWRVGRPKPAQPGSTSTPSSSRDTPAAARPGRIMAWFFGGSASHVGSVRAATASRY